jgi:hypothetical protein
MDDSHLVPRFGKGVKVLFGQDDVAITAHGPFTIDIFVPLEEQRKEYMKKYHTMKEGRKEGGKDGNWRKHFLCLREGKKFHVGMLAVQTC